MQETWRIIDIRNPSFSMIFQTSKRIGMWFFHHFCAPTVNFLSAQLICLGFHTSTPKSFCKYSVSSTSFRPMGAKTKEDMRFEPIPWFNLKWLAWQRCPNLWWFPKQRDSAACKEKNIKNHKLLVVTSEILNGSISHKLMWCFLRLCFLFSDPAQFPGKPWWQRLIITRKKLHSCTTYASSIKFMQTAVQSDRRSAK